MAQGLQAWYEWEMKGIISISTPRSLYYVKLSRRDILMMNGELYDPSWPCCSFVQWSRITGTFYHLKSPGNRQLCVGCVKWPVNRAGSSMGGNWQDAVFPTKRYSCRDKFCNPRNVDTEYFNLLWWLEIWDFFTVVDCSKQVAWNSIWVSGCVCIGIQHFDLSDHGIKAKQ